MVKLAPWFATGVPYLVVIDVLIAQGAMNYSADTVILMSEFAFSVPYLVVNDVVIVQAVV